RDFHVTGVQTCALPIYAHRSAEGGSAPHHDRRRRRPRAGKWLEFLGEGIDGGKNGGGDGQPALGADIADREPFEQVSAAAAREGARERARQRGGEVRGRWALGREHRQGYGGGGRRARLTVPARAR